MEESWLELLNIQKDDVRDWRRVAYMFIRNGKYDLAKTCFLAFRHLTPNFAYDYQTLGAICLHRKEYEEALQFLDQALELDPSHLPSQLNRTRTLFFLGQTEEGLQEARRLSSSKEELISARAQALVMAHS